MHNTAHVQRSEDNLKESILSYGNDVGPEYLNQVIRVGSKGPYLLFHKPTASFPTQQKVNCSCLQVSLGEDVLPLRLYQVCPWPPGMFPLKCKQPRHPAWLLQVFTQQH